MKKISLTLLFLFAVQGFLLPQDAVKELRIIHWNDFHARNNPYKITKKGENGESISYLAGGSSGMMGYMKKLRTENSLVLHGGDDYQGSPISSITKGLSQIELLNLFGLDAFVVGNHEFDYGLWTLDSALKTTNFDYLSANVYIPTQERTLGKPFIIKEINGIKAGIIGVSPTDLKSLTLPANVADIEVLNTDSVIQSAITQLKTDNCDLIILLSHSGADVDSVYASKFYADIDIIIGGHSHTPIFRPRIVNGTLICQAGSYGRWIGKVDLSVDTDKDTIVKYFGTLTETKFDEYINNADIQKKVDEMLAAIEPEMKRVIGKLETDWKKRNCGQWETDAIRNKTQTDIAFLNAGSIRKDLPKGDITVGDVWEINPFGNNIVTFKLSGSTIKTMIENNLRMAMKDSELNEYDMMIISGLVIKYDSKKLSEGSDDFLAGITVNGQEIDPDKIYSISTNNYTASQTKKYFGDITEAFTVEDTNIIDRDLVMEAVEQQKTINSVFENRVIDISK